MKRRQQRHCGSVCARNALVGGGRHRAKHRWPRRAQRAAAARGWSPLGSRCGGQESAQRERIAPIVKTLAGPSIAVRHKRADAQPGLLAEIDGHWRSLAWRNLQGAGVRLAQRKWVHKPHVHWQAHAIEHRQGRADAKAAAVRGALHCAPNGCLAQSKVRETDVKKCACGALPR